MRTQLMLKGVLTIVLLLVLLWPPLEGIQDATYCGEAHTYNGYILNGAEVSPKHRWPFMVSLRRRRYRTDVHCGGVLLHNNVVLTAAHCVSQRNGSNPRALIGFRRLFVFVGAHDLKHRVDETRLRIRKIIRHPRWDETSRTNFAFDLALVILRDGIDFPRVMKGTAAPICLPEGPNDVPRPKEFKKGGDRCVALGWGGTEASDPGKGTCAGDSGGPLMCNTNREDSWTVNGIVSWGSPTCLYKYSVFANVTRLVPWIHHEIKKQGYTLPVRRPTGNTKTSTTVSTTKTTPTTTSTTKTTPTTTSTTKPPPPPRCDFSKFRITRGLQLPGGRRINSRRISAIRCAQKCCEINKRSQARSGVDDCRSISYHLRGGRCYVLAKNDCDFSSAEIQAFTDRRKKLIYIGLECNAK